ncbi:MAG: nicotinate phosphoribosyltransferase [Gammaproteobacteria bacterium]
MSALFTDLYQLTMAYGYWKSGIADHDAVFHMAMRSAPFKGRYAVCAGLATAIEYIQQYKFSDEDTQYLGTLGLFDDAFLDYLKNLKLTVDIDAIEEGRTVFPHEPLIRVKGSLLQCQLLESVLLNIINFQTLIATKAARVCEAAQGDPVLEFGLRRAQGFDGALSASRAAFIGGCVATSNVLAGKKYGIPIQGTHAHSWVMAFDSEIEAFETYIKALPHNVILLVDTYDTLEGIKNAIALHADLPGIRLDSGDLAELSIKARDLLDAAGLHDALIIASSDLDEYRIADYKKRGAKVDMWGVGTRLCTAYEQPALHIAYKLSAIRKSGEAWKYKQKISNDPHKKSIPGILNVRRYTDKDIIYDENTSPLPTPPSQEGSELEGEDLLKPIYRAGKLIYTMPTLPAIRDRSQREREISHQQVVERFLDNEKFSL